MIPPHTSNQLGTNKLAGESTGVPVEGSIEQYAGVIYSHSEHFSIWVRIPRRRMQMVHYWFMRLVCVRGLCFVGYCWIEVRKLALGTPTDPHRRHILRGASSRSVVLTYTLLLNRGTAVVAADFSGRTPLSYCAELGAHRLHAVVESGCRG